jgi:hypothetical protein
MHSGDVFARKGMPLCDLTNHGDALANEQTLAKAVKGIKNVDTIITGHAPSLLKWSDLVEYHDFYKEFADTVRKGFKAGKAADEVAAAYKPSPRYQSYDVNPDRVKADVQSIFAGLKK